MAKSITAKKKCCDSSPRCKRCPVTLRRLAAQGYVAKDSSGAKSKRFTVVAKPPAKALKQARKN